MFLESARYGLRGNSISVQVLKWIGDGGDQLELISNKLTLMRRYRLFFETLESELCNTREIFALDMEEGEEREVYGAKIDRECGHLWCSEFGITLEMGDTGCDRICQFYKPRNGKGGCCTNLGYCYTATEDKFTLRKRNGKVKAIRIK